MWLNYRLAELLGVDRSAQNHVVARSVLRMLGITTHVADISPGSAAWLRKLVESEFSERPEDDHAEPVRRASVKRLAEAKAIKAASQIETHIAPTVLALLSPSTRVPECAASDLGRVCRNILAQILPPLCEIVLVEAHELDVRDPIDNQGLESDWRAPSDRYAEMARKHGVPQYSDPDVA